MNKLKNIKRKLCLSSWSWVTLECQFRCVKACLLCPVASRCVTDSQGIPASGTIARKAPRTCDPCWGGWNPHATPLGSKITLFQRARRATTTRPPRCLPGGVDHCSGQQKVLKRARQMRELGLWTRPAPPRPPLLRRGLQGGAARPGVLRAGMMALWQDPARGFPGPAPGFTWQLRWPLIGALERGGSRWQPLETPHASRRWLPGNQESAPRMWFSGPGLGFHRVYSEAESGGKNSEPLSNMFHLPRLPFLGKWVMYTINKSQHLLLEEPEAESWASFRV